jgi:DivIVA domain-containing protein
MEMSPKAIAAVTFPVVRKGYDPEQVRSFLSQLSRGVEELQNRALQAEAKARLATTPAPAEDSPSVDSITKTLLLAQRTADTTLAEARDEAEGIRKEAADRAESILAEAKAQGSQIITAAEQEALRTGEITRSRVAAEVEVLEARRSALSDDVDALSGHITSQRERVAAAVAALQGALDKPDGLQDASPPALSASPVDPPPPALVPPTELGAMPEPPPTELMTETRAPDGSTLPAPEAAPAPEEQRDPITQEVPTVDQSEPQAWSFFDEGPRSDDRWKR